MNQTNPIFLFRALVGLKHLKGNAKSDAIKQMDAVTEASESLVANIPILHTTVADSQAAASQAHLGANEAKFVATKSKAFTNKLKSSAIKLENIIFANEPNATTAEILTLVKTLKDSILTAETNATAAEFFAAKAQAKAKAASIAAKDLSVAAKALCIAHKSKYHADVIFTRAFFSMTSPKTNTIANAIANAVAISIANTYANAKLKYALIKVSTALKSSKDISSTVSLDKIADYLISYNKSQVQIKQRAWDVSLIVALSHRLSEVFPEEWEKWEPEMECMVAFRKRQQSMGMNHRFVSLITFYRLIRFAFHIGIGKVFILATRRATR